MWTRIMMRTVRDLLENLFGRSSTAERGAFFLLNVFISLCCSWWYSSWRLKLSRSLCLHSYGFISNSNILLQRRHNKLTCWSVEISMTSLLLEGGSAASKACLQLGSATLFPPQTTSRLALLADFLFAYADFFHFSPNADPSPRLQAIYL